MKIAVVGTQCVGKTTFIDDVIAAVPELSKPAYTYRDAIKKAQIENKINRETCAESQGIIFDAVVNEGQMSPPNTIHDRSVMDAVAYTMWPIEYGTKETDITPKMVENMTKTAVRLMGLYDLIVYIPPVDDIEIEDDEFRDTNPDYRMQMAKLFEDLLIFDFDDPLFDKYGYKVATISGTREERVAAFKEILNTFK
jgi:hypothetical protein